MRSSETPLWIVVGTKIESGYIASNSFPSKLTSYLGLLFDVICVSPTYFLLRPKAFATIYIGNNKKERNTHKVVVIHVCLTLVQEGVRGLREEQGLS